MNFLVIAQIIVSIILIILVLLQEQSGETSGIFGGASGGGGYYHTKRGMEKVVFVSTIVVSILFAGLALLNLVLPNLQNLF